MRIALLGYGKMGKAVEQVALSKGHEITYKVNLENAHNFLSVSLENVDVAIDFSMPSTAYDNIIKCFEAHVPLVVGTTGWYDRFDEIKSRCIEEGQTLFYSTNFSLGVNFFFHINKVLAKLMSNHPEYDVRIEETHHKEKLDHPSGTAITLAKQILEESKIKNKWKGRLIYDKEMPDQSLKPHEMLIESHREASVTGTHNIIYESMIDSIEIKHAASNREGFAVGAMLAAEWVVDKKGIFSMDDLLKLG